MDGLYSELNWLLYSRLRQPVCLRCVSRVREAAGSSARLLLGSPPPFDRRRSRPTSERAAERACLRIAQRDRDLSNWNACRIEQLARGLEADFIEQFLERRALCLQPPVQRAMMHRQKPGNLIAGRALGEEQDSQGTAQPENHAEVIPRMRLRLEASKLFGIGTRQAMIKHTGRKHESGPLGIELAWSLESAAERAGIDWLRMREKDSFRSPVSAAKLAYDAKCRSDIEIVDLGRRARHPSDKQRGQWLRHRLSPTETWPCPDCLDARKRQRF